MNKIKKQSGFSLIAIIIVIATVLIGFTGWMVYRNQHKTPPTTLESNNSAMATNTKRTTDTTIKLPIMAIEFTVPNSLKDLIFKETMSSVDPSVKSGYGSIAYPIAFFSVPALEINPNCNISDKHGQLGAVWKVAGQYPNDASTDNSPGKLLKQFPSYYLAFREPAMPCAADPTQTEQANAIEAKAKPLRAELEAGLAGSTEIK